MKTITLTLILFLWLVVGCNSSPKRQTNINDQPQNENEMLFISEEEISGDIEETDVLEEFDESEFSDANDPTYHTDENYKYEYRTGTSGEYEYNYDISGYDQDGDYVTGNIDIEGKSGQGYIQNENGEEISIDVEWVGYGELEGYDDEGNSYNLEVE